MSDYTSWHVGMKVVCVDDTPRRFGKRLTNGQVYTIRGLIVVSDRWKDAGQIGVYLKEVTLPRDCDCEQPFSPRRFRPVQTRKTSIAIFERIRDNPKAPIRERVS